MATASDDNTNQLRSLVKSRLPSAESCHQLPPKVQKYFQFRNHLSILDGVITYKGRVVIPLCFRVTVLSALHSAHSGVTSMLAHAESSVHATYQNSNHCNCMATSQPSAPPLPPVQSVYPFQCVCCYFFSHKHSTYLTYVDCYSVTECSHNRLK